MKRNALATAIAAALAYACAVAFAQSPPAPALACPAVSAHITVHDYNGPFVLDLCVDNSGFSYNAGRITLIGGDPFADGIFRNAFEAAP